MKQRIFSTLLLFISVSTAGLIHASDNDFILVVDAKNLENYWLEKRSVRPAFENAKRSKGGCVSIGFIIEGDGKTSDQRIVASFPDDALDKVWIDVFRRTRYKPAEKNAAKIPVYTVATRAMYQPTDYGKRQNENEANLMASVNAICKRETDNYLAKLTQESA